MVFARKRVSTGTGSGRTRDTHAAEIFFFWIVRDGGTAEGKGRLVTDKKWETKEARERVALSRASRRALFVEGME